VKKSRLGRIRSCEALWHDRGPVNPERNAGPRSLPSLEPKWTAPARNSHMARIVCPKRNIGVRCGGGCIPAASAGAFLEGFRRNCRWRFNAQRR